MSCGAPGLSDLQCEARNRSMKSTPPNHAYVCAITYIPPFSPAPHCKQGCNHDCCPPPPMDNTTKDCCTVCDVLRLHAVLLCSDRASSTGWSSRPVNQES
ncbi:hypothetical protein CBOM_07701 [Ceraceosorus bombacis]|uniref:Uncharacterized protein n=1 Tax=Ceraceosorus bombacis TaxID=401625 RepID=A0A0P1BGX5_9BASI|nr:hypothetical protein CBOM_07701 [Ceraceosorus bombacis]